LQQNSASKPENLLPFHDGRERVPNGFNGLAQIVESPFDAGGRAEAEDAGARRDRAAPMGGAARRYGNDPGARLRIVLISIRATGNLT